MDVQFELRYKSVNVPDDFVKFLLASVSVSILKNGSGRFLRDGAVVRQACNQEVVARVQHKHGRINIVGFSLDGRDPPRKRKLIFGHSGSTFMASCCPKLGC